MMPIIFLCAVLFYLVFRWLCRSPLDVDDVREFLFFLRSVGPRLRSLGERVEVRNGVFVCGKREFYSVAELGLYVSYLESPTLYNRFRFAVRTLLPRVCTPDKVVLGLKSLDLLDKKKVPFKMDSDSISFQKGRTIRSKNLFCLHFLVSRDLHLSV